MFSSWAQALHSTYTARLTNMEVENGPQEKTHSLQTGWFSTSMSVGALKNKHLRA